MREQRYEKFLRVLTAKTRNNSTKWEYLIDNELLKESLFLEEKHNSAEDIISAVSRHTSTILGTSSLPKQPTYFNEDNSFCFCDANSNTYAVLIKSTDNKISLWIVPSTFRNILKLEEKEYGDLLISLLNAVKKQFPNPDDFIDQYLIGF